MSSVPWSRSPSFVALRRTVALLSTVETSYRCNPGTVNDGLSLPWTGYITARFDALVAPFSDDLAFGSSVTDAIGRERKH
jgi:hypothetical protein